MSFVHQSIHSRQVPNPITSYRISHSTGEWLTPPACVLLVQEHGVCQLCQLDTHALFLRVKSLTPPERVQVFMTMQGMPEAAVTDPKVRIWTAYCYILSRLIRMSCYRWWVLVNRAVLTVHRTPTRRNTCSGKLTMCSQLLKVRRGYLIFLCPRDTEKEKARLTQTSLLTNSCCHMYVTVARWRDVWAGEPPDPLHRVPCQGDGPPEDPPQIAQDSQGSPRHHGHPTMLHERAGVG